MEPRGIKKRCNREASMLAGVSNSIREGQYANRLYVQEGKKTYYKSTYASGMLRHCD